MTDERLVLAELLEKTGEGDFLRAVAEAVLLEQKDEWQLQHRYLQVEVMAGLTAPENVGVAG